MRPRPEELLQAALEAAARGQGIDAVLAGLSRDEANELRSLLATASAAASLGGADVPRDAARRSRLRLLRRVATMPPAVTSRPRLWTLVPRFSAAALVALLALGFGLGGLSEVAATSLPGDVLYPVKVAAADLRLRLEFEAGQRLRLELLYAVQRLEDVRRLLALGRRAPVSFLGQVQTTGPVLWLIDDISVRLTPHTRVVGEILPGMLVEVEGVTQPDGTILADELHLDSYDTLGTVEALAADQITLGGQVLHLTSRSVLEPGLAVGHRALVRVAIDEDGLRTVVSAVRFSPPTPAGAQSPPAPTPATRTPPPPLPPASFTPAVSPTDDHSGPGGGSPGPGSDDDGETETPEGSEGGGEPEKIEFEGMVQSIGGSQWVIDGRTVSVDDGTEVKDDPGVGDTVKVVAFRQTDGSWWAEKIELED